MSRIYFHTQYDGAEVRGSERAHFGHSCGQMTWAMLSGHADEWGEHKSMLRQLLPADHYALRDWPRNAKMAFTGLTETVFKLGDQEIDAFSLQLNTAYSMGADYVKLAARLHGQCEIHAYVEGPNRAWLADIILAGRASGFYRSDAGWESVVTLLLKSKTQPVVTSYSVCEQFPNAGVAKFEYPIKDGEKDWNAWYRLSQKKRWTMAITELRASRSGLELKPDNWDRFFFRDGINANSLIEKLYALKPESTP